MLGRRCAALAAAAVVALIGAPSAFADTTTSTNWAGYAAHRGGASFRAIAGSWREPSATCMRGVDTYSSYWVGIGGYSPTSQALDQIGTEVDCTAGGQVRSSAWYELVPAGAIDLKLAVHPGDLMRAAVSVDGRRVSMSLLDVTRRQGFTKTFTAYQLDTSSAEWIVEAPSECVGDNACRTLTLSNFGTAAFTGIWATTVAGHVGGLNDPSWQTTKIKLIPDGQRFFVGNGADASVGTATPSPVAGDNHSFTVSYATVPVPTQSRLFGHIATADRPAALMQPAR